MGDLTIVPEAWEIGAKCWPVKVYPIMCGDANGDGSINVGDAVFVINYVFKSGPPSAPLCSANTNGDSSVNVGDAVYLINYVFKNGPPAVIPCCP
ncbi:MAG: hypothetical protein GY841_03445 [FCB group bacterium]|nr:hypothetical protein [FCB group bacterium]